MVTRKRDPRVLLDVLLLCDLLQQSVQVKSEKLKTKCPHVHQNNNKKK